MENELQKTSSRFNDPLFYALRTLLFKLDPETAHNVALNSANFAPIKSLLRRRYTAQTQTIEYLGMQFNNRVGLAAGLDKNGDYIDALGAMGFGFIEIGTVTPKPQAGNTKPRMFRLKNHEAIINRMGFNNLGVDHLVAKAEKRQFKGPLGINIGKNASTDLNDAVADYLLCLERAYAVSDYITINVSSPNTQGLRDLQHGERLKELLDTMKNAQAKLSTQHGSYKPILVKIAPDMSEDELHSFCDAVLASEIDGVIAGNTTNSRDTVASSPHCSEAGGLSGKPLMSLANVALGVVGTRLAGKVALIGVGGISEGQHAADKLALGANLVQLYTGFIYHGPALVHDCIRKTT